MPRQVAEQKPEILKDASRARETALELTNLEYGGELSGQLLKFSKQMEQAYKHLAELESQASTPDAKLMKFLKYVGKKKPWFKDAQARSCTLHVYITTADMRVQHILLHAGSSERPQVWAESKVESSCKRKGKGQFGGKR